MYASVFCSRISPHGTRHSPHGIKHIQYSLYRRVRPCKAPLILGFRAFIRNITFFYIRMSSQIIEILVLIHYHLVSMIQFVVFNPDKASKLQHDTVCCIQSRQGVEALLFPDQAQEAPGTSLSGLPRSTGSIYKDMLHD